MDASWKTRRSLILRARDASDQQAWMEFVKYYERFIFHVLNRMKVARSDSDDIVQNVLLKLWKNLGTYDHTKSRFRTWLGVVVRNAVYDHFAETRHRRDLIEAEREAFELLQATPASEVEQRIEQEWADYVTRLALDRIRKLFSDEAVRSFTMSLNGASTESIADAVGITVDSVYTLKSRVKARFIKEVRAVIVELET